MVFRGGSGETEMDGIRETWSEESGASWGRKQQGAGTAAETLAINFMCWGKKAHPMLENTLSNLIPSDITCSRKGQPEPELLQHFGIWPIIFTETENQALTPASCEWSLIACPQIQMSKQVILRHRLYDFVCVYMCVPATEAKHWSKGSCRLRPEPHNELEINQSWGLGPEDNLTV